MHFKWSRILVKVFAGNCNPRAVYAHVLCNVPCAPSLCALEPAYYEVVGPHVLMWPLMGPCVQYYSPVNLHCIDLLCTCSIIECLPHARPPYRSFAVPKLQTIQFMTISRFIMRNKMDAVESS